MASAISDVPTPDCTSMAATSNNNIHSLLIPPPEEESAGNTIQSAPAYNENNPANEDEKKQDDNDELDDSDDNDEEDENASSSVQVAVRVRPFLPQESGFDQCVEVLPPPPQKSGPWDPTDSSLGKLPATKTIQIGGENGPTFTFDCALAGQTNQRTVYDSSVAPLVRACLRGYNATVLAYGQTGSGKTFTILGPNSGAALQDEATLGADCQDDEDQDGENRSVGRVRTSDSAGVIPRALRDLFIKLETSKVRAARKIGVDPSEWRQDNNDDGINRTDSGGASGADGAAGGQFPASPPPQPNGEKKALPFEYEVRVQFLELYGEEVRDLLCARGSEHQRLQIRDGGPSVEPEVVGASETKVNSAEEALLCLARGSLRRVTGATAMNAESSRSHAIMSVVIEQTKTTVRGSNKSEEEEESRLEVEVKCSKFHFVDLAGSERQKRSQAEGKRLKEGIDINKGLLVLGNVISALGDPKKRGKAFVPYRDSKLTRLLKGSLGGNHKTLMIACVSPSSSNLEESLNCLRYANRAKNIQNNAVVNVDAASRMVAELRGQVQALAKELLRIKEEHGEEVVAAFSRDLLKSLSGGGDMSGVKMPDVRKKVDDRERSSRAEEADGGGGGGAGAGAAGNKDETAAAAGGYAAVAAVAAAAEAATTAATEASNELTQAKEQLLKKDSALLEKDAELEKMKELLRQAREEIFTMSEELYATKAEREYYKMRTPDEEEETMSLVSFEVGVLASPSAINDYADGDNTADGSVGRSEIQNAPSNLTADSSVGRSEIQNALSNITTGEEDDRSVVSTALSVATIGTQATNVTAATSPPDIPSNASTPKSSSKRRSVRKYLSKAWSKSPRSLSSSFRKHHDDRRRSSSPVPVITDGGVEVVATEENKTEGEENKTEEEVATREEKVLEKTENRKPPPPPTRKQVVHKPVVHRGEFVEKVKDYEKEIAELKHRVRDLQKEVEQKNQPPPSTPLFLPRIPDLADDEGGHDHGDGHDLSAVITSPLTPSTTEPIACDTSAAHPKDLPVPIDDDNLPTVIERANEAIEMEKQHLSTLQQTVHKYYGTEDDGSAGAGSTFGSPPLLVAPKSPEHRSALAAEEMAEEKELHTITKKYLSDSDGEDDEHNEEEEGECGHGVEEGKEQDVQLGRRPKSASTAEGTDESFQRRQEHMNAHFLELSKSIAAKEELINALHASEDRYETMRGFYESKIEEMETMVNEREKEREKLLEELHKLEEDSHNFSILKRKLKLKENHIAALRKKQSELKNLTNVSSRSASVLTRLQQDIEQMKRQKVDLQRQMSSEAKAHREQVLALRKEALQRNKEMLKLKRISQQKQAEAEKMQRLAKQRADEVGRLRTKYKESEKKLRMETLKRGVMERAGIDHVMMGRRSTVRRTTAQANGVGANSLQQKNDKPKPLDDESAEKILSFFDAKVAEVGRKEATADKLAHEWEDHLELIIRKEELSELLECCDKEKEESLKDELDALHVQLQYKEGRIRTLSRRLGSKPPSRKSMRGGILAQNSLLEEREFRKLCSGASNLAAAQAASKILFGMVVRERRRVASLARTASTLDQKALEAEVLAASKDAALRSQLEEQRHERASMAQTQQEQILSLMSLVQEEEKEGSDESSTAAGVSGSQTYGSPTKALKGTKSAQSMLTILVNERTAVLEEQLTELRGEREAKEIYKAKVKESNAALDEKRQECIDLQREIKQVRSALRQIREYVKKTERPKMGSLDNREDGTDNESSCEIVVSEAKDDDDNDDEIPTELISAIIQDALHPPKKTLRKRGVKRSGRSAKKPALSPSIQRHVELMHSSDSEGNEEAPEWAGDIMADLALIAEGEMPPALKKGMKRPPVPKRKGGGSHGGKEFSSPSYVNAGQNVFDRLTDPGRFTGVQKTAFSTKEKHHHRHAIPSQGDWMRAGTDEMSISPEEQKPSRPRGGRDKGHVSDSRSVSSHQRSFCDLDSLDGKTVDSLPRSASMPVTEYTKQNVFQRLHKNVTHSYAVGRKGKDEIEHFDSPTPSVPSEVSGTQSREEWAAEYTKQDVFERLQKTTTESTAVKYGKDRPGSPPAPPHID